MAVRDENIRPAGIGKIHEPSAPADIQVCWLREFRGHRDVGEFAFAQIAVKSVRLFGEISYEHSDAAVVKVIAPVHAH